ncbi:hypothetical protein [Arthrobacter pascens]|nr:hypothetical protein [Arthrobacter pascens]MBN3496226.1 hypothetical protein [Arthrobacter pascens]
MKRALRRQTEKDDPAGVVVGEAPDAVVPEIQELAAHRVWERFPASWA